MSALETALDRAASAHPESSTLSDFRAPREMVDAEAAALAEAERWITPHRAIAALAGSRAVLLDWQTPSSGVPQAAAPGDWVVFPASTLGRKGAYEVREAARTLNLPVRICGPVIESPDFWDGIRTERAGEDGLAGARAVVLPAWVEHQPRRLLAALGAGVPVIASEACGLDGVRGVVTIPSGDTAALIAALRSVFPAPTL
jgi:hypothetical protein